MDFKKVISYRRHSHSGDSNKHINIIIGEPTSAHSLSSLVLLSDYYRGLEVQYYANKLNFNIYDEEYKKCSNYALLKILRQQFSSRFLKESVLICEYCQNPVFIKDGDKNKNINKNNLATVDHKIPLIDEPDWFDETNLAVSCSKCNNEKGPLTKEEWLKQKNK